MCLSVATAILYEPGMKAMPILMPVAVPSSPWSSLCRPSHESSLAQSWLRGPSFGR